MNDDSWEKDWQRDQVTVLDDTTAPVELDESGTVTLLVHHSDGVHVAQLNPNQDVVIGRAPPATVVVREPKLSREHARFSMEGSTVYVEDLGSMNGTEVNGRRVKRQKLSFEDRVTLPGVIAFLHSDSLPEDAMGGTLRREMEAARRVQEGLVGPEGLIERGPLWLAGYYRPASVCGGDFWNYFEMGPGRTLVIIGDVTGHGVPTAMLTATVKGCCETLRSTHSTDVSVVTLMQTLNQVLYEVGKGQQPMTMFAALIDMQEHMMSYANAGHTLPYIAHRLKKRYKLRPLTGSGNRLGHLPKWKFREKKIDLRPDDGIVWYTDGLTDREDRAGTRWGEKRLRKTILANAHLTPDALCQTIVQGVFTHSPDAPVVDDITLVVAKIGDG